MFLLVNMDAELVRKVFRNKRNNQLSITLPRKICDIKSKKVRLIIKEWIK